MDKKTIIELIDKAQESILSDLKGILGEDGSIYKNIVLDLTLLDKAKAELSK